MTPTNQWQTSVLLDFFPSQFFSPPATYFQLYVPRKRVSAMIVRQAFYQQVDW